MKSNKPEMICQGTLISLGFTKSMIAKLLPEPELVTNPHYKCAAPMKLWEKSVALAVMDSPEYSKLATKAATRKAAGKKAYQSRIFNLQQQMIEFANAIDLQALSDGELREKMQSSRIRYYQTIEESCERYGDMDYDYDRFSIDPEAYVKNADEETTQRWIVNYIRHELIDYDRIAYSLRGKIGGSYGYVALKLSILNKIAEVYPKYSEECEKQSEGVYEEYSVIQEQIRREGA